MEKLSSLKDIARDDAVQKGLACLIDADAFHRDLYLEAIGWFLAALLLVPAEPKPAEPSPPPTAENVAFTAAQFFGNTTTENFQALKDVTEAWENSLKVPGA